MDAEGSSVERLHTLLLDMTGRVDDDAVNSAREMIGAGRPAEAAELLAGCLLAGRVPVSPAEQYSLRWVLDQLRSKRTLADRLQVVETVPVEEHRFNEPDGAGEDIAEALRPIARRLTGVQALWCVSRVTPAGVTYGAVPRRVLLAEVNEEGTVTAAGYQLLEALRRAGISCSVDVFGTDADLPDYHRDALAAARRITFDATAVTTHGSGRARTPRRSSGGEPAGASISDLPAEPPARVPPAEPAAESVVEPAVEPELPETAPAAPEPSRTAPTASTSVSGSSRPTEETWFPEADSIPEPESVSATESLPEQQAPGGGENNPRVPAAVDAKLTDRERNLLRKLHEELAQREQDRDDGGRDREQGVESPGNQDSWLATMPGTGGFPPINAPGQQHPPQIG